MKPISLLLVAALAFTLPHMLTVAASSSVCSTGIYALLAPLKNYPPAEAFCAAKYHRKRHYTTVKTTTKSTTTTTKHTTTTTKPSTTTTTTKPSTTTTKPSTSTTTKPTNDPQASLYSQLVSEASAVISTFCSCILPPKTVSHWMPVFFFRYASGNKR